MPTKKPIKKASKKGGPVKALSTHKSASLIGHKTGGKSMKQFKKESKREEVDKWLNKNKAATKNVNKKIHDADDFDEGGKEAATEDQLSTITKEARKAVALQKQINDLQAATETLNNELAEIIRKTLPSLFDSAGLLDFTLDDGSVIEIKDVVSGSLPSADKKPAEREAAIDWIKENGGDGIIKTYYNTEFGVGQEKLARMFEAIITKAKFIAKKTVGVHPQTLCAFVREKLENGEEVPVDKLGVYTGRHAKIKLSDDASSKADSERVKPKARRV